MVYHRDPNGRLLSETRTDGTKIRDYFYAGDLLIAVDGCMTGTGVGCAEREWFHSDRLGNVIARTNRQGTVTKRFAYHPFGEAKGSVSGTRLFSGNSLDESTGFYDFGSRLYSPDLGRFLSTDPVWTRVEDGQRANLYSYALDNPLRYVDPDGNVPLDTLWDVGNVIYDVVTGRWDDLAFDLTAMAIPYVPAGVSKLRHAKNLLKAENGAEIARLARNGGDAIPQLGSKLEYFLGRATGNAHNIERSTQMPRQLERVGLPELPATRQYLTEHLTAVLRDPSNIARVQANGRVVRESLLTGPRGGLKFETVWEGDRLITGNLFGGL